MRLIRNTILLGAGYVLGTRAGTSRYDEIVRAARSLAASPDVQNSLALLREKTGLARTAPHDVVVPPVPDLVTAVPTPGPGTGLPNTAPPFPPPAVTTPVMPPPTRTAPVVGPDLGSPVDPSSVRRPGGSYRP